jgi:hypothetical protein
MNRVSDILKPEFARSWYEAVALVQEVVSQLAPGAGVPDVEDLLIDPTGALQFGFGSDSPGNPVSGLGSLLQSLLDGVEAPIGLRQLADDNAKESPSLSSVAAFQRALAFYERPARGTDLRALATRLAAAPSVAAEDPETAFERLREKVAAKAEAKPTKRNSSKRISRKAIAIAGIVELGILAAIVVYARPQYLSSPTGVSDRVEQKLADTISGGLNKMGMADGSRAPAAALPAEAPPVATAGATHPPSQATTPAANLASQKARARTTALSPSVTPILTIRGQLPEAATSGGPRSVPSFVAEPDVVPTDAAASGRSVGSRPDGIALVTYSQADMDVEPPRINRQQLPRQPEPGDDTGYFDVIISETGEVERVQLISPMRRFQERMLMAAAKAWRFRPALRNGQPVRYRMRIAIILTDKP